ncbi:ribokinase [Microbacterium sp. SORGH_AS_0862]|uniref:ribokinase n=1 Tax=Microbacterium sp. SORGH_AS_0862 TaxID=3041789 RepID=UPI002790C1F9|nr:ribokinase [Microbacterium sp. SORGH_AS_0862]MDQ1204974.1 ribokinase [Microbacterium sp. SORGH_AS_0862]
MASSIAVLGSANMDLVVRVAAAVRPGETVSGSSFATGPGGKGLNQAVAAARAGASVRFLGAVGADEFGGRLRGFLLAQGIDASGLVPSAEPTGIAAITVTDDGENAIVVVAGANADDRLSDSDRAAIAGAGYLVVQLERPVALVLEAMRWARGHGVTTVLTPAPVPDSRIDELVSLSDVLLVNEHEAAALSGDPDAAGAARVLSRAAGTVVVTLGAAGALVAQGGEVTATVAARPVSAVDTTGAGDTFAGVLIAWLAAGATLHSSLEAASAAAALTVTRPGAAASMPQRADILTALQGDRS